MKRHILQILLTLVLFPVALLGVLYMLVFSFTWWVFIIINKQHSDAKKADN